jgi:hypothetical protein
VAGGPEVVVALLNGQHGAQELVPGLAPLGNEGPICNLLTTQPVKLQMRAADSSSGQQERQSGVEGGRL